MTHPTSTLERRFCREGGYGLNHESGFLVDAEVAKQRTAELNALLKATDAVAQVKAAPLNRYNTKITLTAELDRLAGLVAAARAAVDAL